MKKQTRQVFGQYETRLGQLNDTDNVAKTFSVTPSVQQKLETKMQESSEFLSKVNIIGVTEQEGEKLGLGVSGPIAGRTNTKDKERETRDLSTMDSTKYRCEQTNFDTHLSYAKLDAWAKFQDFQSRVANAILTRQALDRIVIGFNGVKAMADTLVKLYGFKAALGMVGAAMLYIVLPPLNADGTFNKGEFVARLACAGVFSCLLGGTAYQLLCAQLPGIGAMALPGNGTTAGIGVPATISPSGKARAPAAGLPLRSA